MSRARPFFLALLLIAGLLLPARAALPEGYAEQRADSGADDLPQRLPADVRELTQQLVGDPLSPEGYTALSFSAVLRTVADLFGKNAGGPFSAALSLLAVTAVCAMLGGVEEGSTLPGVRQTYHTVSAAAACGLLLMPFMQLLRTVGDAVESAEVFLLSFVPVYGALLSVGGSAAGALSYQTTLLSAAQLLGAFVKAAVMPVLCCSLALGCVGAVTEGTCLTPLSAGLHKAVLWALGLFSTVFSGVLGVQQMVAAAGDSLGSRTLRFSLANFVPVVGGALSEAYSTVLGCVGLLRSTVGGFGVLAVALIVLPPLVCCLCWQLCLALVSSAAGMFRLTALETLSRAAAGAVRVMIAVLAVYALLLIVSATVVVFCAKGAGG